MKKKNSGFPNVGNHPNYQNQTIPPLILQLKLIFSRQNDLWKMPPLCTAVASIYLRLHLEELHLEPFTAGAKC